MRDLKTLTRPELQEFFDSFDLVLCDIDGVLWLFVESIPGSELGIHALREIGKKVCFVSNNSSKNLKTYVDQLNNGGFAVTEDDLVTPIVAIPWYLRKIEFEAEIYVVGMAAMRGELQDAGFKIAEGEPDHTKETIPDFMEAVKIRNEKVGAVILDVDVNLTYLKLQRAIGYLKRPEIVFLVGPPDKKVPAGRNHLMLGPGYFKSIVEEITGRLAVSLAKPSAEFNECIVQKLKIGDPKRVLVIGDSVHEDMGFATVGGYRKLLVFSGLAKKEDLDEWKWPEEYRPDFYVDNLKVVDEIVREHFHLGM